MVAFRDISESISTRAFGALADRLLEQQGDLPLSLRLRLQEEPAVRPIALALALADVVARTRRPLPITLALFDGLLAAQRVDGSFATPGANACVIRAMLALRSQVESLPAHDRFALARRNPNLLASLDHAVDCASYMLRLAQLRDPRNLVGDEVETALVLWQLRGLPALLADFDVDSLRAAADSAGLTHDARFAPVIDTAPSPVRRTAA